MPVEKKRKTKKGGRRSLTEAAGFTRRLIGGSRSISHTHTQNRYVIGGLFCWLCWPSYWTGAAENIVSRSSSASAHSSRFFASIDEPI